MMLKDYSVVVLGAGGVGKTSMVVQFIHGFFTQEYNPTIEDCYRHLVQLPDGYYHTVEILDTAGTHQFPAMRELSIRSGHAFVIVYSIESEESFREAMKIADMVNNIKGRGKVPMVLVGNKSDLNQNREVDMDRARQLSVDSLECAHLETSAKYGLNINSLFTELLSAAMHIVSKDHIGATIKKGIIIPRMRSKLKRLASDSVVHVATSPQARNQKCTIL
ncbi:ras-related protein Rap-1b-like [Lineus longissimus]|uniref:ras-related protein Rap-1b-like n=1 Tax=Lineus longissimus TaxID=88925 RepID=UPI002B4D9B96